MFIPRARVLVGFLLGATLIAGCATPSAATGTPVAPPAATAPAAPTSAPLTPTPVPTVQPPATPVSPAATDTPSVPPIPTADLASPTVVASPGAVGTPPGSLRVTQADNGHTISLRVGQTFLVALGNTLDWNVTVADPTIVSRVVNVLVVRGAQGLYRANAPGQTTLTATGRPICAPGQACPMFIQLVKVNLVVR